MITLKQLQQIVPHAGPKAEIFLALLNDAMAEFGINTPMRQAAFLAQIAFESGGLRYTLEIASGKAYDTGNLAKNLGNTPEADGDGQKYKGRGLIQVTGHNNYEACGKALGLPLLAKPELLEEPENACRSAGWYWASRGLNELADRGAFKKITLLINGGFNGLEQREAFYMKAQEALAC